MRRLQAQYWREGEALWQRTGRGERRHQNLTLAEEAKLLAGFLQRAERGGLLEASHVRQAYEQAVGYAVPQSTVYEMLARHGWRKLAPRPCHPQVDTARQQALKKTPGDR